MTSSQTILACFFLLVVILASSPASTTKSNSLPESETLPLVSFGTAGGVQEADVRYALEMGFKSFDTAMATEWYDEDAVSRAVADVPRDEVFITSKVHPRDLGFSATKAAGARSAAKFGGYVDVLLLHYSHCWGDLCDDGASDGASDAHAWRESWRAIEELREEGKVLVGAGVSNFHPLELRELGKLARDGGGEVRVVQDWCDPFHQAKEQRAFCASLLNCTFQAYSSLGGQWLHQPPYRNVVMESAVLHRIAENHGVNIPTLVLSWQLQLGIGEKVVCTGNATFARR